MYCGTHLPDDLQAQAAAAAKRVLQSKSLVHLESAARGVAGDANPRMHYVIETTNVTAAALAAACSVSLWEAGQWQAAARYRLFRVTTKGLGGPLDLALREKGIRFFALPEEALLPLRDPIPIESIDVSSVPVTCSLREGADQPAVRRRLAEKDLSLVLTAPIKREKVKDQTAKRTPADARLEDNWLVHFHSKAGGRPFELDPRRTAFEGPGLASAYMRALDLVRNLRGHVPLDESFKSVVPALSPGADPLSDLEGLKARPKSADKGPRWIVLDNTAQFREYSAWRGAVELALLRDNEATPSGAL